MKIEVGKTYKTKQGHLYHIECQLSNEVAKGKPFLGVGINIYPGQENCNGFNWYDENGCCGSDYYRLLPNKLKKEGWICRREHDGDVYIRSGIFPTEAEARAAYPSDTGFHKIEWEEDET